MRKSGFNKSIIASKHNHIDILSTNLKIPGIEWKVYQICIYFNLNALFFRIQILAGVLGNLGCFIAEKATHTALVARYRGIAFLLKEYKREQGGTDIAYLSKKHLTYGNLHRFL